MNKYHAVKANIDGFTFDSKAEAQYYIALREMAKTGEIQDLVVHPAYRLQESFTYNEKKERPIAYEADFQFLEDGAVHVVDVKGVRTEVYKLKRKLFLYKFGKDVVFQEVRHE